MSGAAHSVTAYLGLGTNIGTEHEMMAKLREAVAAIGQLPDTRVSGESLVRRTKPWGGVAQPDFLNMAVRIETILPPLELLRETQALEAHLGRTPTEKWGPRIIDIDILLYGDLTVNLPNLSIPHPHLHQRDFAWQPILEIDATVQLPGKSKQPPPLTLRPRQISQSSATPLKKR